VVSTPKVVDLPAPFGPSSQRLRELQDAGIVDVDRQPGRREVWYRLTPAGKELAPAVEALFRWGLRQPDDRSTVTSGVAVAPACAIGRGLPVVLRPEMQGGIHAQPHPP
jgi:DNA-binding MarR family transcriptional regulator